MGGGEKSSKNKELRKTKADITKSCVAKLINKWDQIGPRIRVTQKSHKTESIRILTKHNPVLMMGKKMYFTRMMDGDTPFVTFLKVDTTSTL